MTEKYEFAHINAILDLSISKDRLADLLRATNADVAMNNLKKMMSSKKTQHARGWNAAESCTNCVYKIPAPRVGGPIPFFGQAGSRSLPHGWLCGGRRVQSWPDHTHKQTHSNHLDL